MIGDEGGFFHVEPAFADVVEFGFDDLDEFLDPGSLQIAYNYQILTLLEVIKTSKIHFRLSFQVKQVLLQDFITGSTNLLQSVNNLLLNVQRLEAKVFKDICKVLRVVIPFDNDHSIFWSWDVLLNRWKSEVKRDVLFNALLEALIKDDFVHGSRIIIIDLLKQITEVFILQLGSVLREVLKPVLLLLVGFV